MMEDWIPTLLVNLKSTLFGWPATSETVHFNCDAGFWALPLFVILVKKMSVEAALALPADMTNPSAPSARPREICLFIESTPLLPSSSPCRPSEGSITHPGCELLCVHLGYI